MVAMGEGGRVKGSESRRARERLWGLVAHASKDPCEKIRRRAKKRGLSERETRSGDAERPEAYAETRREMRRRLLRADCAAGLGVIEAGARAARLRKAGLAWPGKATSTKSENAS